jgi:hypothetical protein
VQSEGLGECARCGKSKVDTTPAADDFDFPPAEAAPVTSAQAQEIVAGMGAAMDAVVASVLPSPLRMPVTGAAGALERADGVPTTVTVTWGEEVIQAAPYCTYRVGPFSVTAAVRPDETREQAMQRVYGELGAFAERERQRKAASFVAFMGGAGA